jgi:hypothetical protein
VTQLQLPDGNALFAARGSGVAPNLVVPGCDPL